MTTIEYDAQAWADGLAAAIEKLASIQRLYRVELGQRRQNRAGGDRDLPAWSPWEGPMHELSSFYSRVVRGFCERVSRAAL